MSALHWATFTLRIALGGVHILETMEPRPHTLRIAPGKRAQPIGFGLSVYPFCSDKISSTYATVTSVLIMRSPKVHILPFNGYQDPQFFVKAHKKIGQGADRNFTTMRLLHYRPLLPDRVIMPGQLRCGEHVDFGSISLLFQDPNGGLQETTLYIYAVKLVYHSYGVMFRPHQLGVEYGRSIFGQNDL